MPVPENDALRRAEGRIGHRFADAALLAQALTHRSAGAPHNERLEFLGDSLVNQFIAEVLFRRWPKADEGVLTRARAELVRESALAEIARKLDLGAALKMGPGEMKSGGHRRESTIADAVEGHVVAAIYLDSDFDACRRTVLPWFGAGWPHCRSASPGKRCQDPPAGMAAGTPARAAGLRTGFRNRGTTMPRCSAHAARSASRR